MHVNPTIDRTTINSILNHLDINIWNGSFLACYIFDVCTAIPVRYASVVLALLPSLEKKLVSAVCVSYITVMGVVVANYKKRTRGGCSLNRV